MRKFIVIDTDENNPKPKIWLRMDHISWVTEPHKDKTDKGYFMRVGLLGEGMASAVEVDGSLMFVCNQFNEIVKFVMVGE